MSAAQCGEAFARLPKRGQCRDAAQRATGASTGRSGSAAPTVTRGCSRATAGIPASGCDRTAACNDSGDHARHSSGNVASAACPANPNHHCSSAEARGETRGGPCRSVSCGARPDATDHAARSNRDRARL